MMKVKSLLLVENEPLLAVVTRMDLENLGYEVEVTSRGREAIRIVREHAPDLILMDFQLDDDLDGAETAGCITAQSDIPIIFLTGTSDIEAVRRCLMTKPYGFVQKPCRNDHIQKMIEHAADMHSFVKTFNGPDRYPLHDELTGVWNGRLLLNEISTALHRQERFGILYIDIDHLKDVNLQLGRHAGDRLLQICAAKIQAMLRPGECLARVRSDEFALLTKRIFNAEDAWNLAEDIDSLFSSPVRVIAEELNLSVTIGFAGSFNKKACTSSEEVLREAATVAGSYHVPNRSSEFSSKQPMKPFAA